MSPRLVELLERARGHVMTAEERRAQRISFAYGNGHFDNPDITLELVERVAREMEEGRLVHPGGRPRGDR